MLRALHNLIRTNQIFEIVMRNQYRYQNTHSTATLIIVADESEIDMKPNVTIHNRNDSDTRAKHRCQVDIGQVFNNYKI